MMWRGTKCRIEHTKFYAAHMRRKRPKWMSIRDDGIMEMMKSKGVRVQRRVLGTVRDESVGTKFGFKNDGTDTHGRLFLGLFGIEDLR